MFAIYNEQGREFRSTLEELYRVKSISSIKGMRKVASGEYEENEQEITAPNRAAIKAYKAVIHARRDEEIYHVSQIMKRPVATISDNTSTTDCYTILEEKGIKQLPVLNEAAKPIGLITKENLLKVMIIEDGKINHSEVDYIKPIISQPIITTDPVTDIRRVAKIMYDQNLNCIPVTNDADIIVGIITRTDIVHAVSIYPGITLWA